MSKPRGQRTQLYLKIYLNSFLFLILISCQHGGNPPAIDIKLYEGNSETSSYDRAQANEKIYCNDPKTDNMVALSYDDFKKIVHVQDSCLIWEDGAKAIERKLKACGLMTKKNVDKISDCLNK